MLDALYDWIRNLAFYLVVMTAVLEVIPGNAYKKYIQFFTGLVLILLVVTPMLEVTGTFGEFRTEYARQEEKLQEETKKQEELFESADVFGFLPENHEIQSVREEQTGVRNAVTENPAETGSDGETDRIEVEEIRVGENQETDMELDTFRE